MKFSAMICAVFATANAVKQGLSHQGVSTTEEGYMGETETTTLYNAVDLDSIQVEIEGWYSSVAAPFIGDHKDMVYKAALAEMEREHGALLETCDEGTACREKLITELRAKVKEIWKITLQNFKETIEGAVVETRTEVERRWVDLENCQVDFPCCSVSEIFWLNNVKKVKQVRAVYSEYVAKWFEFDLRRIQIEHICPISIDYECAAMGPCWDGSARDAADDCTCPEHYPPACPDTPCRNGHASRDINTCKCEDNVPSNAFDVFTTYVDSPESVVITWNDLNGRQDMEGYYVYLKDHRVHCNEDQTLVNESMTCTVPLGTLLNTPFHYTYGDLVQATIADVLDGMEESERSDLGGTAVIPTFEHFITLSYVWMGDYTQIDYATVADDVPTHVKHDMKFDTMYVGKSVVVGEGNDTVGHFTLEGTVDELNVAFKKQYAAGTEGYFEGDYLMYEGTLDHSWTNIGGNWETYEGGEKKYLVVDGVEQTAFGRDFYKDHFTLYTYA